jgi:4-diphosphocytidyl-2-C-methyl-D-erythritol kinase
MQRLVIIYTPSSQGLYQKLLIRKFRSKDLRMGGKKDCLLRDLIMKFAICKSMIVFPNCKINLGLLVTGKRPDGFHTLQTVFYPLGWSDALEVIEHHDEQKLFIYSHSGLPVAGDHKNNLVYKAWKLIINDHTLPPLKVHLHKNIPMGAGLGGGSSDAAFFINIMDSMFSLRISERKKLRLASEIGSDCAFFIKNRPLFAGGRGELFASVSADLSQYYVLVVYPGIHVSTSEAFRDIVPALPAGDLKKTISRIPVKLWKDKVSNQFEATIFKKHHSLKLLKDELYLAGALYASLSGSGSAIYGIFEEEPLYKPKEGYLCYLQKPAQKIL